MDTRQRRAFSFEPGKGRCLIVVAQRFLTPLPHLAPFGQEAHEVIVQPATFLQLLAEETLLFGWIETILERLEHAPIPRLPNLAYQAAWAFIPSPEEQGLLPHY